MASKTSVDNLAPYLWFAALALAVLAGTATVDIAAWRLEIVGVTVAVMLALAEVGRRLGAMRRALSISLRAARARANIATTLNQPQPLERALHTVCREIRTATDCAVAVVLVTSAEVGEPYLICEGSGSTADASTLLAGDGQLAQLLERPDGQAINVALGDNSPERTLGRQMYALPLRAGSKVLGALAAFDVPSLAATEPLFWQSIAEQIALALERYRFLTVIQRQATIDDLTGLHNHRFFTDHLTQQVALAERLATPLSILMIDIDHFKDLNDSLGHYAGDKALMSFAEVLTSNIRRSDLAARYGGEEFVVVMANTDSQDALRVAEKLRRALEQNQIEIAPHLPPVTITASIGVASYPHDTSVPDQLMRLADEALYRAKNRGRNQVCVATNGGQILGRAQKKPLLRKQQGF